MEMFHPFDPQEVDFKKTHQEGQQKDQEKYSPKCTQKELSMMIDCDAYKGKGKYNHIESKVSRIQSAVHLKGNTTHSKDPFAQFNSNLNLKLNKVKAKGTTRPFSSINQFKRVHCYSLIILENGRTEPETASRREYGPEPGLRHNSTE